MEVYYEAKKIHDRCDGDGNDVMSDSYGSRGRNI